MCLFCEIASHNIPSKVVYEDDKLIAFLDLAQTTKGHTLVVPKIHSNNILEADKETIAYAMNKAQDIGNLLIKKLDAKGMNILVNTNEVAGQTINHTHIHLIPRYTLNDSVEFKFSENKIDLDSLLNQITM